MKEPDIQTLELFLTQISNISKKYEEIARISGRNYNLFTIAGIESKETIICKVIADLLNPQGLHCKGDVYLKLFKDTILSGNLRNVYGDLETKIALVSTEYVTDEGRRIDIVIESNVFIPIEAKIYAGDQENQVADYWIFAKKKNNGRELPVLYLTLNGDPPSETSFGNGNDKYERISFSKEILSWLDACLTHHETIKTAPIREIIIQLIGAIKSLCRIPEEENMEKDILDLIIKNEENYRAAEIIGGLYNGIQGRVQVQFFGPIFEKLKGKGISVKKDTQDGWYSGIITIKDDVFFQINYNWKMQQVSSENPANKKFREDVAKIMNVPCEIKHWDNPNNVWFSDKVPLDIKTDEDAEWYKCYQRNVPNLFVLYKIYSEYQDQVVDKIIETVKRLDKILI
jgi:hypothetical protein